MTLILSITLWVDIGSAPDVPEASGQADMTYEQCVQQLGEGHATCDQLRNLQEDAEDAREQAESTAATLTFYVVMLLFSGLLAVAAGALWAFNDKLATPLRRNVPIIAAAGGVVMLGFSIMFLDEAGNVTRVVLTLIFGILITLAGLLGSMHGTARMLGVGPKPGAGAGAPGSPGGFGPPGQPGPPGGFGAPGQPPQQPGQPGGYGGPPPQGQPPQGPPPQW
ncbi:hypothetical protein [Prauserella flava]|uniref:hypothetical protein n=1 Tax=Prauserella flava TaxID=577679 RepID=UPI002164BD26|nr:hypothetical protein [Prauserella flava]